MKEQIKWLVGSIIDQCEELDESNGLVHVGKRFLTVIMILAAVGGNLYLDAFISVGSRWYDAVPILMFGRFAGRVYLALAAGGYIFKKSNPEKSAKIFKVLEWTIPLSGLVGIMTGTVLGALLILVMILVAIPCLIFVFL